MVAPDLRTHAGKAQQISAARQPKRLPDDDKGRCRMLLMYSGKWHVAVFDLSRIVRIVCTAPSGWRWSHGAPAVEVLYDDGTVVTYRTPNMLDAVEGPLFINTMDYIVETWRKQRPTKEPEYVSKNYHRA